MPVMSGFVTLSFVGPRLLNVSIVSCPESAASMAPTEMTPSPASDWLGTLLDKVLKLWTASFGRSVPPRWG